MSIVHIDAREYAGPGHFLDLERTSKDRLVIEVMDEDFTILAEIDLLDLLTWVAQNEELVVR